MDGMSFFNIFSKSGKTGTSASHKSDGSAPDFPPIKGAKTPTHTGGKGKTEEGPLPSRSTVPSDFEDDPELFERTAGVPLPSPYQSTLITRVDGAPYGAEIMSFACKVQEFVELLAYRAEVHAAKIDPAKTTEIDGRVAALRQEITNVFSGAGDRDGF
jgi:hypothetical protein